METTILQEEKAISSLVDSSPRILKEREIINLLMSCGLLENIARDILKICPEVNTLTEKIAEVFKTILRESLSILEKEGVPKAYTDLEGLKETTEETISTKSRIALCKICKDSAAIHVTYPEKMRKYFRMGQKYRGPLTKNDWLCKGCYGDWYRDNREWIASQERSRMESTVTLGDSSDVAEISEDNVSETDDPNPSRKKELYIKSRISLLFLVAKNLSPQAFSHRKMLVRYIALNEIQMNQLPTALYYLRKTGNAIIDQEEFERQCGIGKYSDLFMYSSWKAKHTRREILHLDEETRFRRKEEKRRQQEKEAEDRKTVEMERKATEEMQARLQAQSEAVMNAALESTRAEKWRRLAETRARENEERKKGRELAEKQREKQQEKRREERQVSAADRAQRLQEADLVYRSQAEACRQRREERDLLQRREIARRMDERQASGRFPV